MDTAKGYFLGGQYVEIRRWCKCGRYSVAVSGDTCGMCKEFFRGAKSTRRPIAWAPLLRGALAFILLGTLIVVVAAYVSPRP